MKYIEVDEQMDRIISTLCDIALKAGGLQMFANVRDLLAGVKDKQA